MQDYVTFLVLGVLLGFGCSSGDSSRTAGASGLGSAGTGVAVAPAAPTPAGGGGAALGALNAGGAGSLGGMMAGSSAPPAAGSFQAAYNGALREMCPSCHIRGGIFGSLDLSSVERAYDSLVDKDATTTQPGVCGGMGKLVTPGNCETSLLYDKIAQPTPKCGRRMPLSSTTVTQAGIDAVCAWIMAGAKKD